MNSTEEGLLEKAKKLGVSLNDLYSSTGILNLSELQVRVSYAECYRPLSLTNIIVFKATILAMMVAIERLMHFLVQ